MKKSSYIVLILFLSSFSSFIVTAQPPDWNQIIGVGFSDRIIPGTLITWELTTFETTGSGAEDWNIIADHPFNEGDLFKINVTVDPDDLGLTHPEDIFTTNETWCDFYLNNDYLTDTITDIDWRDWNQNEALYIAYILPTTITLASGEVNIFDYFYDYYSELDFSDGTLKVKKTDEIFSIEQQIHITGGGIFVGADYDYTFKITYNIEWGVAVLFDLTIDSSLESTKIKLETGIDEIKVPFEWFYGMLAFLILGFVMIKRK